MSNGADTLKTFFSRRLTHLILIVLLGLLAYSNTFHVPFQWDESTYIIKNPFIKDFGYFLDPSAARGHELYGALKSRYIGYLTFAMNFALGGLEVTGYHLFNLVIHILNALLVYLLVILAFKTPFLKTSTLCGNARHVALFSGLLFVAHPVQTEAVTYIFQRLASLAAFFYLLSIVAYVNSRLSSGKSSCAFYIISLVSAVLAMKTKENTFTLPIVILLFELSFFTGPVRKRLLPMIPLLLTLLIIPVTLAGMDKPVGDVIGDIVPATRGYQGLSRDVYLFTQIRVIVTYLRLLFLPVNQNLDYDYPVFRSFFDPSVLLSFVTLLVIFSLAIVLFFLSRTGRRDRRLVAFGIFWFFIALSVESSIVPIPVVIDEYRLYLPSVGAFLAVVTGAGLLLEKLRADKAGRITAAFLFMVPLLFAAMTFERNATWGSKVSLWKDVVRKSPSLVYPHNNLGVAYMAKGRLDDGIRQFRSALTLKPDHAPAYNNLGVAYARGGRYNEAMEAFQNALRFNSNGVDSLNNIGLLYRRQGDFAKAEQAFRKAMRIDPYYAKAHYNLGVLFEQQGRNEEALREFNKAVSLDPEYYKARMKLEELSRRR
jgi:Tfp pilus assembly protein PilF